MSSLFAPLAERLRPQNLDDYIGQEHLVGKGKPFRNFLENGNIPSMIFWGPPGTGKTTLALLLAQLIKRPFHNLSAINSGVKDVREIIGRSTGMFSPILFIDEIHRFNKSQQDALLTAVEKGQVTLIGATTENPSFEVNSALLSRCQVYILEGFGVVELKKILERALQKDTILKDKNIEILETNSLFRISGGDGRKLLNLIEIVVNAQVGQEKIQISDDLVETIIQKNLARYDKSGEQHYDIISAFIKSIRGSDPNAALYWMARMLVSGEDVKFIARRMLILASEDVGLANPTAMMVANACFDAVNKIGYPESRIILSQTAIYLSTSPKSNSAYTAIDAAIELAEQTHHLPVPLPLRNAPTKLMKDLNYGKDYAYAHAYEGNFTPMDFLPNEIKGTQIYKPQNNTREVEIRKNLFRMWASIYDYKES
ncbi:MAG: replication-associated recombination protein A [Leadbetterella sp.]